MTDKKDYAVILDDVKKSFDGKEFVLKGIDLKIPKGSLTGIIGFSGTGKSVMLKHMLGLYAPTSGNVSVLGTDLSSLDDDEMDAGGGVARGCNPGTRRLRGEDRQPPRAGAVKETEDVFLKARPEYRREDSAMKGGIIAQL